MTALERVRWRSESDKERFHPGQLFSRTDRKWKQYILSDRNRRVEQQMYTTLTIFLMAALEWFAAVEISSRASDTHTHTRAHTHNKQPVKHTITKQHTHLSKLPVLHKNRHKYSRYGGNKRLNSINI